jgi:hypothetical protein
MPKLVASGAKLKCSLGLGPGSLSVLPNDQTSCEHQLAATVHDMQPKTNIASFGMCQSLANPPVATATAAAGGVLTPQPCQPVVTAPWSPGSATVRIANKAALTGDAKCRCQWGGVIEIVTPGPEHTEMG